MHVSFVPALFLYGSLFLLLYFKKARSGALSGILEQGGGTQCCKERHSAAFLMEDGTVFQAYYFNEDKILK